jgi:hypothetical protein
VKTATAWIRVVGLLLASALMPLGFVGVMDADDQDTGTTQAQALEAAQAAKNQILTDCHYSETETNPKKMRTQLDCVQRRVAALKRKILIERSLQATVDRAYGVSITPVPVPARPQPPARNPPPTPNPALPAPGTVTEGHPSYEGQSASNTPSTCGKGGGANNPLIRVHRMLMAPKNASDDFGHRLGRRFIVYQVTISNDNKDFQFLLHDVTVDLSTLFGLDEPGSYLYSASSQELTLLRGIPEKGQDLDPRNLTLHILQGIGSVGGGVSGLTPVSAVMGSAVAAFNGPFIQSFVGIAPDHTATQLNRLSDSAYIVNTVIEKQRAKTIAIFIPEATILSKTAQNEYWKDPQQFLATFNLDQADVCVDGAFITTLAPPTLISATLTSKPPGLKLDAGIDASLTVSGSNLVAGDTEVVGLGPTVSLTNANGTSGSVDDIKLPSNYTPGVSIHLTSAANPSLTSATIPTTVAAPTLTTAVLTPTTTGVPLANGVQVTVGLVGTNLTKDDTQVVLGTNPGVPLTTATGTTGSVVLTLQNYSPGMTAQAISIANPNLKSAAVVTRTSAP